MRSTRPSAPRCPTRTGAGRPERASRAAGLQALAQVLAGGATDAFGPTPVIAVSGVLGTLSVLALTPLWRSAHPTATADHRPPD